jgi:hypothetical protein
MLAAETGKIRGGVLKCQSLNMWGSVGMADEHDLGSCAARRGGSNPPFPIQNVESRPKNGIVFS